MPAGKTIVITGASSGIGRALALAYAQPGHALVLIGRDAARLAAVAADCVAAGAQAQAAQADVRDTAAMQACLLEIDARTPIDLLVANAGISTGLPSGALAETPEAVRGIFAINVLGVLNTVEPLIAPMCARKSGHIAITGSIAALRGLPYSPAYCATKAAVHLYSESLRGRLEREGVTVSLIVPGFVHTPLNAELVSAKPFAISDTRAAAIVRRGLDRKKAVIAFPRIMYWGARLLALLPPRLVDAIMNRMHVEVPVTKERALP